MGWIIFTFSYVYFALLCFEKSHSLTEVDRLGTHNSLG